MNTTKPPTTYTAEGLAAALGVSLATISRLRSGDRRPSMALMSRIEKELGWSIETQARAWINGNWHLKFETRIRKAWIQSGKVSRTPTGV